MRIPLPATSRVRSSPMERNVQPANAEADRLRQGLMDALLAQASDAVILTDREGTIRIWNAGAEAIFGHAAADVIGANLDVIIPERLRRAHWDGFARAIHTGETKYYAQVLTTRSMHRNGSKLYVDLSFGLVRDRVGAVIGALAIGRDSTARRAADDALRARIATLQQQLQAAALPR
jgi:PAS domain S-box-containing protein